MARLDITPLDPDSTKGREAADRLTDTLADVRLAIAERERAAALRDESERAA